MSKTRSFKGKKLMVQQAVRLRVKNLGVSCISSLILLLTLGVLLAGCDWLGKKASPPKVTPPAAATKAVPSKTAEIKAPEVTPPPRETFAYSTGGRRDPFVPLLVARAPGKVKGDAKRTLEVGDLKLVGIVWDKRGYYYALVETPQGLGYTLKQNDQIGLSTVVSKITKDSVHFLTKTRAYTGAKSEAAEVVLKLRKED